MLNLKLDGTFHLTATQATGAYGHAGRGTVDDDSNLLRIGSPNAASSAFRVANIVARHGAFFSYIAIFAHDLYTSFA